MDFSLVFQKETEDRREAACAFRALLFPSYVHPRGNTGDAQHARHRERLCFQCCFWTCVAHRCSCWNITVNDGNSSVLLQQQVTDTWYQIRPQTLMHSTSHMRSDALQLSNRRFVAFIQQLLHKKNIKRAMHRYYFKKRRRNAWGQAKISQPSHARNKNASNKSADCAASERQTGTRPFTVSKTVNMASERYDKTERSRYSPANMTE